MTDYTEIVAKLRDPWLPDGCAPLRQTSHFAELAERAADAIEALQKEAQHWKANHGNQVAVKRRGRERLAEHHSDELAKARNDALEEAAKIADEFDSPILHIYSRGPGDPLGDQVVPLTGAHVAAAIRARKT